MEEYHPTHHCVSKDTSTGIVKHLMILNKASDPALKPAVHNTCDIYNNDVPEGDLNILSKFLGCIISQESEITRLLVQTWLDDTTAGYFNVSITGFRQDIQLDDLFTGIAKFINFTGYDIKNPALSPAFIPSWTRKKVYDESTGAHHQQITENESGQTEPALLFKLQRYADRMSTSRLSKRPRTELKPKLPKYV